CHDTIVPRYQTCSSVLQNYTDHLHFESIRPIINLSIMNTREERQMQTDLSKGTALVTGAFSGIGLATPLKLAQDGWAVYAAGRDLAKSTELTAQAQALRIQVKPIVLDVTDERSIAAAISQIDQESGRLDLLVNNAGGALRGAITDASNRQIRQLF